MSSNNSKYKLSSSIQDIIDEPHCNAYTSLPLSLLRTWQQRAEYLETSLAQWQGEEYDLEEPMFMVQLNLAEVDLLLNFIFHASNSEYVTQMVPTETWKMLEEKIGLLNSQVTKFNEQKISSLAGEQS